MTTTNSFKSLVSSVGGLFTADVVGDTVRADAQAAFLGLCEVLARQTEDERVTKGTAHKNKFGFSKKHVTRGTALAQKFQAGEDLTMSEVSEACEIAYAYRMQLWMIAMGAVPVNNLNLRPGLTVRIQG
jgi:hypothetical protein